MPYDELGNYIQGDEPSVDQMKYALAQRGSMPLRNGSDVPYLASEVPNIRVPLQPKEVRPASSSSNIVQALADKFGITAIPQSILSLASGLTSIPVSNAYGIYKGVTSPNFGTQAGVEEGRQASERLQQAMTYEPTSQASKDINESLAKALEASKLPPYIGHIPRARPILTPNDVRVMGANAKRVAGEVRDIRSDFANAQAGIRRENVFGEPTYGSSIQAVAEDIGDVLARQQARRNRYETSPRSSVEVFGDMVPETNLYAVRNTGEGQMLRPTATASGVAPTNVTYGAVQEGLRDLSPTVDLNRPDAIIANYESNFMAGNTPEARALQANWGKFMMDKAKELYPDNFTADDAMRALRKGYTPNQVKEMKLGWFKDYIADAQSKGFNIPSLDEYLARAESANLVTSKIIPNLMQKYAGTPNDPFLESAKKGITITPEEELIKYETPSQQVMHSRVEGGFEAQGEIADKLMPVAESKLETQSQQLNDLIAQQAEVGRTEGMMVPYPDGRIDPETGAVEMATNPNYAQFTNKIGALRKMIEDTENEIRNLRLAKAYENVSDAAVKMGTASEYRYNIPTEEQQFYPQLFATKPKVAPIAPIEYKVPNEAKMFELHPSGVSKTGMIDLATNLMNDIMQGKIPPEQVPTLSQPHTITKYMADMVAPRLEKEKAARLAMKDYKVNVEQHFIDVVNAIPDSMRVGTNAKLLWIDDATPEAEINQHLSDATFILDHCIGNSGNGRGLKNLFTGDERSYIPFMDPATGQKFKNAGGTSSYMDDVLNGEKDIMMILDDKTGMHVGTIELTKTEDIDTGDLAYDIGFVSGYKNHSNKHDGIDPKYREALRDALNMVKDMVVSTSDNEARSGVYDVQNRDQLAKLKSKLDLPTRTTEEKQKAWLGVQKIIRDTLDGDRYFTLESAEDALKQYKAENPSVPAVRQAQPSSAQIAERNIVMQGLSRENLDPTRQFNAARLVTNNNRFVPYPTAESEMDLRTFRALRTILDEEKRRSDEFSVNNPLGAFSDYQLFRNLQNMVDAIDQGDMRFADFGLNGDSELIDLRAGLQKQANAVGQLAHYADVLQRNGFQSPLPSEQTGVPEWQTYQRYLDELSILGIDNPRDFRTRLEDTINHADLRMIDPQLDDIQRANLRELLTIHSRSIKQAIDHPAPASVITETRGAQNAPAPVPALPTDNELRSAIQRGFNLITNDAIRNEVERFYDDVANEMVADNLPITENPFELVRRLYERGDYYIGEGEAESGVLLRGVAREISTLLPANPPASMALANQNAIQRNPERALVAGHEALSNSILDAIHDFPYPETVSDRLRALQWRENLVDDPAGLIRNIRIEADAEARAGNEQLASIFYDIANLIADERGETLFTPNGRQAVEPRRTPRDIAETVSPMGVHQSLTQRQAQVNSLTIGINNEIRSIGTNEPELRQAELFYQDPNNLPASIVDYTNRYEDAERIANYLLQHVQSRLANLRNRPAQQDNGNNFEQIRRINDAITQRGLRVNREHLGISQQFDNIVQATQAEFNPAVDTERFVNSLHQRANSLENHGRTAVHQNRQLLATQLRALADDVLLQAVTEAPALPAPDPIQADLDRLYNSVSESIRTRHPTMIDSVMNSRNTRSNLADVIRTDPIRYGLENYSPDVVNQVVERIIEDGLSNGQMPAPVERPRALRRVALGNEPDPVAQHFDRVEQGVNQPEALGALDRNARNMVNMQSTNLINGDRNALTGLDPAERQMVEVLTRYREPEPTLLNPLIHRRLINTLTSETYNPALDGEALIRMANTRSGMFNELGDSTREQIKDIVNKWNFLRFPNYRPPEAGMGLQPEGRKKGGLIRKKMMMTEGGKVLTPYEQFKLDNEEFLRKGHEENANRNKYDPYKGSGKPVPTTRSSGSAGIVPSIEPSGSGSPSLLNPLNRKDGGAVHMAEGGSKLPEMDYQEDRKPFIPPAMVLPYSGQGTTGARIMKGIPVSRDGAINLMADVAHSQTGSGTNYNVREAGIGYSHKVGPGYLGGNISHRPGSSDNRIGLMYALPMAEGGQPLSNFERALNQPSVKHKFTEQDLLKNYGDSVFESFDKAKARKRLEPIALEHATSVNNFDDGISLLRRSSVPLGNATPQVNQTGKSMEDLVRQHMPILRPEDQSSRGLPYYQTGGNVNLDAMRYALMKGK